MTPDDAEINSLTTSTSDSRQSYSLKKLDLNKSFWFIIFMALVILAFLIVFIAQNNQGIVINYLGFHWYTHLGVALLLSAISCGIIVALLIGWRSIYIHKKTHAKKPASHGDLP